MSGRGALATAACGALLVGAAAGAAGQSAGPTVVADHVDNPRGLTVDHKGNVYVASAGHGGATCLPPTEDGVTCVGFTSSIIRVAPGRPRVIVKGLLSGAGEDGSFGTGADGVSVATNGTIFAPITDAECMPVGDLPPPVRAQIGHLMAARPGGPPRPAGNMRDVECRSNPDGTDRNSNPYSVLALGRGRSVVVDAGGNTLLSVDRGKVTLLAVMPKNGKEQSVPTSITRGPDGAYYVGELAEGAGPGKARVFRVVPGKRPTVYKTGFTGITGVAFGLDGSLYVTEFSADFNFGKPSGDVVKVAPDGKRTRIGRGQLFFPAGAAVDLKGNLYVSNWSILPGRAAPAGPFKGKRGQVVRFAATP